MLNNRQKQILKIIEELKTAQSSDILERLRDTDASKVTIIRDLNTLEQQNLIIREGEGRSVKYRISQEYKMINPINIDKYFEGEADERSIIKNFNFEIFDLANNVFSDHETRKLKELKKRYEDNIKKLPQTILKKEYERLTIEFSWKSSKIEGNTYSLLETERLLKEKEASANHTKEEAIMLLNHKNTLNYINTNLDRFRELSIAKIEEIHQLVIDDLKIERNIRNIPVGITGTNYKPLDNDHQIKEALEKMCGLINGMEDEFNKSILTIMLISYIQPFEDGNKRTSRLAGNALLMSNGSCPLSYRSVDELEYKKATLLFYEQNNISYFKEIFIEQFEFAVNNYFVS